MEKEIMETRSATPEKLADPNQRLAGILPPFEFQKLF